MLFSAEEDASECSSGVWRGEVLASQPTWHMMAELLAIASGYE